MQRTLVFDVDDTICVHTNRDYANAAPIAATIDRINALHSQGYRIVLYTARGQHSCNGDLQMIKERNEATLVNWLERHHVQYDEIRFGKPLGDWYIDDKAMPLETFLNTTFSKLKGGSGSDVYREGDTVIKRAAKAKQEYDWYRRAAGITGIRTPAVKSFVVDTLYLEYIDGTPLADKLSADLIIKATSAAYAFQAEADPAANRLEAYISNLRTHDAGATAVTTEFFCLEVRATNAKKNYETISECAGFDIVDFYKKYSTGAGYLRLNRPMKQKYIQEMETLCHKLGMRFYVSDAHFKEACDNSCCCALPEGWDYSRGNFSYALQLCRKNGIVHWAEIDADMNHLDFPWWKAEGYNTNSCERRAKFEYMSMREYLRYLWNNPKAGQSPYTMFGGVMKPAGRDARGDLVYVWDKTKTFVGCGGGCAGCHG